MIDLSFSYSDLEYFFLVLVRVTCFIYVAPFFSMNNTPNRVKIGLGVFISYLVFMSLDRNAVEYVTVLEYVILVMREALAGFLIGWGAQLCMAVASFAGSIMDMETGLSMVSLMDPATNENATFTGVLYQYMFTLLLIITGMYEFLLGALIDTFTLIPVGGAIFNSEALLSSVVQFMADYVTIGFRICLPMFCVMLLLNCILGILAKVSPQLNMFAVGMQLKVLTGLAVLFLTVRVMPYAADFVFTEMKTMVASFVGAMT